jgi:hypothetical protein
MIRETGRAARERRAVAGAFCEHGVLHLVEKPVTDRHVDEKVVREPPPDVKRSQKA